MATVIAHVGSCVLQGLEGQGSVRQRRTHKCLPHVTKVLTQVLQKVSEYGAAIRYEQCSSSFVEACGVESF